MENIYLGVILFLFIYYIASIYTNTLVLKFSDNKKQMGIFGYIFWWVVWIIFVIYIIYTIIENIVLYVYEDMKKFFDIDSRFVSFKDIDMV